MERLKILVENIFASSSLSQIFIKDRHLRLGGKGERKKRREKGHRMLPNKSLVLKRSSIH